MKIRQKFDTDKVSIKEYLQGYGVEDVDRYLQFNTIEDDDNYDYDGYYECSYCYYETTFCSYLHLNVYSNSTSSSTLPAYI